jgi:hypothetical protein
MLEKLEAGFCFTVPPDTRSPGGAMAARSRHVTTGCVLATDEKPYPACACTVARRKWSSRPCAATRRAVADLHWSCRPFHIPANLTDPLQNFTDRRSTLRTIMPNNPERLVFVDGHAVAFHSWFTSYPNSVILVSLIC